jgi:Domain of unknown function (DUF4328)
MTNTWDTPVGYAPPVYPSYHNPQYSGDWRPELPKAKLTILSWLLYVLFGLSTVPLVAMLVALYQRHALVARFRHGGRVTLAQADAIDHRVIFLGRLNGVVLLVVGIVFVAWLYRVRTNGVYFGGYLQRRHKLWAVFGWVVPVVSLVYPYQIVTDAVREAKQAANPNGAPPPMKDGLVKAWWLVFLLSLLLRGLPGGLTRGGALPQTLTVVQYVDEVSMAYTVTGMLAAVLALLVVRHVTGRQNAVMGPRR